MIIILTDFNFCFFFIFFCNTFNICYLVLYCMIKKQEDKTFTHCKHKIFIEIHMTEKLEKLFLVCFK